MHVVNLTHVRIHTIVPAADVALHLFDQPTLIVSSAAAHGSILITRHAFNSASISSKVLPFVSGTWIA
jgi:hypothetical protein